MTIDTNGRFLRGDFGGESSFFTASVGSRVKINGVIEVFFELLEEMGGHNGIFLFFYLFLEKKKRA